jgi:hypothetical protein
MYTPDTPDTPAAPNGWWARTSPTAKIVILVIAAVLTLAIVVGVARALGASGRPDAARDEPAAVVTPAPSSSPTEEPAPSPTPSPEAPRPDASYVQLTASKNLDDYAKDIDDMVVTLDERGFWRLLTNYGELVFNLAQLEALQVTSNIEEEWAAALAQLATQTTQIGDNIGDRQYDTLRADLAAAKDQTAVLHEIVSRAVTDT